MSEENEFSRMAGISKIEVHDGMIVPLTDLTYKELQNVAISLSLPGNLKWFQLIQLVQARQRGDEHIVASIVNSSREQRGKKRQGAQVEGKRRRGSSGLARDYYMFPQLPGQGLVIQMGADSSSSRGVPARWSRTMAPMSSHTEVLPTSAQVTNDVSREFFGMSDYVASSHLLQNILSSDSPCTVTTSSAPIYLPSATITSPQPLRLKSRISDGSNSGVVNPFYVPSVLDEPAMPTNQQHFKSYQLDTFDQDKLLCLQSINPNSMSSTSPYHFLRSDNVSTNFPSDSHCQYLANLRSEIASSDLSAQFGYSSIVHLDSGSVNMTPTSQCQYFNALRSDIDQGHMAPDRYRQMFRNDCGNVALTATAQSLYTHNSLERSSQDNRKLLDQQYNYQPHNISISGQHMAFLPTTDQCCPPPLLPLGPYDGYPKPCSHNCHEMALDATLPPQEAMPTIQKARTATVSCYTEPICTYMQYSITPFEVNLGSSGTNAPEDFSERFIPSPADEVQGQQSTLFPEFRHNNQLSYPLIYNYLASTEDQLLEQQQTQRPDSNSNSTVPDDESVMPRATSSPRPNPAHTPEPAPAPVHVHVPVPVPVPVPAPAPASCANTTDNPDVPQLDESILSLIYEAQTKTCRTPCKHHGNGCLLRLGPEQVCQHEQGCEYQDIACPVDDCDWNGRLKSLAAHLTENHKSSIMSGVEKSHMASVHALRARQKMSFLQETGSRLYVVSIHCNGHLMHATIQAVPSGRADRAILARGSLEVIAKDGRPLSWRGRVRPIHEPVSNLWTLKQCLTLDPVILGLYAGTKLTIHAMVTVDNGSANGIRRRKKQRID